MYDICLYTVQRQDWDADGECDGFQRGNCLIIYNLQQNHFNQKQAHLFELLLWKSWWSGLYGSGSVQRSRASVSETFTQVLLLWPGGQVILLLSIFVPEVKQFSGGTGGRLQGKGTKSGKLLSFWRHLLSATLCRLRISTGDPTLRIFIPQVADSIPEEQLGCDNESFVFDNDEEPLAWALRGRKMDFTASSPDEKVQHYFCQENLQLFFEGAGGGLPTFRSHLCWRGRGARHRQDCRLSRLWSALSQDLPPPAHPSLWLDPQADVSDCEKSFGKPCARHKRSGIFCSPALHSRPCSWGQPEHWRVCCSGTQVRKLSELVNVRLIVIWAETSGSRTLAVAVRELTETEVEVFEEDLAAAAQSLESREERMQEVSKPNSPISSLSFSGFSRHRGATNIAWSYRGGGQAAGRRWTNPCRTQWSWHRCVGAHRWETPLDMFSIVDNRR